MNFRTSNRPRLRWVTRSLLLASAMAFAACGPSSAEVRKARTAIYTCPEGVLFEGILASVKERSGQVSTNRRSGLVVSDYRWHNANGARLQKGTAMVGPGDLAIGFAVAYSKKPQGWVVRAKTSVVSHVVGSPRGLELSPKHADWPDWADDKLNVLIVAIHKKLKGACPSVDYATTRVVK